MGPTVLPVATRALVGACRRLGLDVDRITARAGLDVSALADADGRVPARVAEAVWQEAYAAARDPALALHAAELTPYGAFRVLDYLGATGATLGEGLRRVAAYFPLIDPRGSFDVAEQATEISMTFRGPAGTPPPPAQEYTLAILALRVRHLVAPSPAALGIRFAFPRPADTREHARVLGVEPSFDAPEAAFVVGRGTWDRKSPGADPGLFATLEGHARAQLASAAGSALSASVRAAVGAELPGREPTLAAVARRLGTSARTLQRRLGADGSSFAAEVDAVRRERAEAFLRSPDVSIAEVSWLVGFAEQSAFARAFRRWTGARPSAWRAGAGAPAPR